MAKENVQKRQRVAINGFGRIGRLTFRSLFDMEDMEVVAINDLNGPESLRYSLQYDSTQGRYEKKVEFDQNHLIVDGQPIRLLAHTSPDQIPWKDYQVDFVVEATGRFTELSQAKGHLSAGAKKVIISAPAKGDVPTLVLGVNHQQYRPETDHIVSNASCTTNCLAPLVKVLLDHFGFVEGLMTTVHAVTSTQVTIDGASKKDLRGGRGAFQNIIPASTGAAKAVALCLPQVAGKLTGMSFRVPVADVSVVDLTVKVEKQTSLEEISKVVKEASQGPLKGILQYCEEQLVSSDFIGNTHSSIFDAKACLELNSTFFKLISWYDNERGYAQRVADLIRFMSS